MRLHEFVKGDIELDDIFGLEREKFPLLKKKAYFITASTGAVPSYVHDAINQYQQDRYLRGGDVQWNGMDTMEMLDWSKTEIGKMIGCEKEEIAFADNSSRMMNLLIQNLPLEAGDNVIITDPAFVNTRYAWQVREADGVNVKCVHAADGCVTPEDILEAIDERTKVVTLCFVESSTGFRYDLEEIGRICRERKIILCVDGVQGIGVMPIHVKQMKIDFLAANDYKWMMGYCGTGFAYVSKDLQSRIKPWGAGWMSDVRRYDTEKERLEFREDAGRFEMGYPNVSGIYGLGLVARRYHTLGAQNIKAYVLGLRNYLCKKVEHKDYIVVDNDYPEDNRSQLVKLKIFCNCPDLAERLAREDIIIEGSYHSRQGCYYSRISLHYYNNKTDIDRLLFEVERSMEHVGDRKKIS